MPKNKQELIALLEECVTEQRKTLIQKVLAERTRYLVPVLENVFQPHNASACVRSAECFGIQDLYVIENGNSFHSHQDITVGSDQWVDIHRYNNAEFNTPNCFDDLRKQGYRIAATGLGESSVPIEEADLSQKTALVFGSELPGLSEYALENADYIYRIPMKGFTQSFNISVSVALSLFYFRNSLQSRGIDTGLSKKEKEEIYLRWLVNSGSKGKKIYEIFLNRQKRSKSGI